VAPVIDNRVLVFGLALSALTAASCGLAPALQAVRRSQVRVETKKRRWRRLAGRAPIIVQVAGSIVFLGAASLAARSVHDLNATPLGFDSNNLIVFRLSISEPAARMLPSPFEALTEALEAAPGVVGATFSAMPLVARAEWTETVQSDSGNAHDAHLQVVGPDFFETIATPVVLGRSFSSQDRPGKIPVAVVNARMAREVFGRQSAIGR
jgi:hypothetical protein